MTIRELKKEVDALGFSSLCAGDDSLICTANRALRMIHTAHPKTVRAELGFFPEEAIMKHDLMVGEGVEQSLSVPSGQLIMKLQGEGEYILSYGRKRQTVSFSCEPREVKINMPEDGEIIFTAKSVFCAWDIAVYKRAILPYEDAVSVKTDGIMIDLKKVFPDLFYLTGIPTTRNGDEISGLETPDTTHIFIRDGYRGIISLAYRGADEPLTEDSDEDDEIDISDELSPLLPLLVAYFLCLDDEKDVARLYLSEYEKLSRALRNTELCQTVSYVDVNGWA